MATITLTDEMIEAFQRYVQYRDNLPGEGYEVATVGQRRYYMRLLNRATYIVMKGSATDEEYRLRWNELYKSHYPNMLV